MNVYEILFWQFKGLLRYLFREFISTRQTFSLTINKAISYKMWKFPSNVN